MSNFQISVNAVLPVFLLMAAGYLSKRAGIIKEENVGSFNALAFKVFMPALLFKNICSSQLSHAVRPAMLGYAIGMVLLSFALGWLYARFFVPERGKRSVVIQGFFRSNLAIVGLPIASALSGGGDVAPVAVMMALVVPLFNVLAVICLEYYNGEKPGIGRTMFEVLKNPLILGSAAGFVCVLSGIELPEAADSAIGSLAGIASPLMLFLLGAFFRFSNLRKNVGYLVPLCLARLLFLPGLFLALACALGFRDMELIAILAVFAAPAAANTFTMAQQMGGDAELAGQMIVLTSAFCAFTLFMWIYILKSFAFI